MNKLNIELTNCFGIDSLNHEFDFGKGNTFSIYARNGLMKTSFAKTFQLIQQGKKENISDAIFGEPGSAIVQIDGQDIEKKQVFVVKSYESSYESDISSLLIKGDIQTQLKDVFKVRTKLLKALEKDSGLKIKRTSLGKTVYELEPTIVKDFDFNEKDILYSNDVLKLEVEYYQDKPFKNWKNNPKEKDIFALLPFVRNLIEYGVDQNISHTGEDFLFLTSLLHEKQDSRRITFGDIEPLYKHYAGVTQFDASVGTDVVVLSKLYSVCDDITTSDTKLENKIVLSIGIRHKAEEYIIQQIHNYTGQLSWRKNKQNYRGTNVEFMNFVQNNGNQTRELFNGYKQFGDADKIKILNEVNIMTPEHIHVNSFMYEPILDMDIVELHRLYHTIKNLI